MCNTRCLLWIGGGILATWLMMALCAPFAPHDPFAESLATARRLPPSWEHPFGTDRHGRDVFSRVLWGSRISLITVVAVAGTAFPFGFAVGMLAGYYGGWFDKFLMALTDMFLAFPKLLFAMALTAVLGRSLSHIILAMLFVSWPSYARLSRAETLRLRHLPVTEAARALGASDARILGAHIFPMCFPLMFARLSSSIGSILLTVAGLNFLGFGVQLPTPEWGFMVSDGREDFFAGYWWIAGFPALAIGLMAAGWNVFGEALRDYLEK